MRYGIIFVLAMLLCTAALAEYMLTKDRTPGGLYVVGPDLSPDSAYGEYLYYSPDAGTTLVKKDSADYGFLRPEYSNIAADYTLSNLYKVQYENFFHSSDYGATWNLRSLIVGSVLASGLVSGEVYFWPHGFSRSTDFGETYSVMTTWRYFNEACLGWGIGEIFGMYDAEGLIYYSGDTMVSRELVYDFGHACSFIRRGSNLGEIYVLSDSIYFSDDYCTTFTGMNTFPLHFDDISPGNNPGELYASRSVWFFDPDLGFRGGHIKICFSKDYGATFACLTNSASGITFDTINAISEIPQKPEKIFLTIYPNPFNSDCRIQTVSISKIAIYDIGGNLSETGVSDSDGSFIWRPEDIPTGMYLIKSGGKLGKVIYIR
jgi:hypothetical protein